MKDTNDRPYWWPEPMDAAYFERLRVDYPENAHLSDEELSDAYDAHGKYADTWDGLKDARGDYDHVADRLLELDEENKRLKEAIKPFAKLRPPDNWPGQCRMRIDNREEDGTEFLSYHGENQEHLGILPTLAEWRALREAGEPEEKP